MIKSGNCSSVPNAGIVETINSSNKRNRNSQIDSPGKRVCERRSGLPGFESKTITSESSHIGSLADLSKTGCAESSSVAERKCWPAIDYSSLKQISDPEEYLLTCTMLENAEKEKMRLKGETFPKLSQLQSRRDSQRRPGLPMLEGFMKDYAFKLPSETTTSESSHIGTLAGLSKTGYAESTIDYSSLKHISDPEEYFLTCRMLENAEKEKMRLKGETFPKLSQPQSRRDRQHRPGLPILEGFMKDYVFKLPSEATTSESSHIGTMADLSKTGCADSKISQVNDSQTVEPGSKLFGSAETRDDTKVDEKLHDELKRLLSKCEKVCTNPVDKSRGLPFSISTENKSESPKLREISPVTNDTKFDDVLPNMKERLSLIIQQFKSFTSPKSNHDRQDKDSGELSSIPKILYTNGLAKLLSYDTDVQSKELGNLKSDCNDVSAVGITELEQETLKTKLLDAEIKLSVDPLSVLEMAVPLTDVQSEQAKITALNSDILQNPAESQQPMLSDNESKNLSLSKSKEFHSRLSADAIHFDGSFKEAQNSSINLNVPRFSFEDEMHSPVDVTSEKAKNLGKRKVSQRRKTCSHSQLIPSTLCERLSDNAVDQQMELPCEVLNGNTDQGCSESLGSPDRNSEREEHPPHREKKLNEKLRGKSSAEGSSNRNLERDKSQRCYGKKQNKDMRRKSLAGAGTVWTSGVRRSTRIRVKPLQHWCGERLLYGRVHDSLATVIGLKKLETPPADGRRKKATMRVESFVQEQFADLVAKAALY